VDRQNSASVILHGTMDYWTLMKPYTEKALNKMVKKRGHSQNFSFVIVSVY